MTASFFFKFSVKFLRNYMKYAVLNAISGELKVFTFESSDYSRRINR